MELESGDFFSQRSCEADGAPMVLEDRDLPTRSWACPACGGRTT